VTSQTGLGNATGPFVTVTVANLGNNGLGFSSDFQLAGHRTSFKIKERGFVAQGTIVQALRVQY